MGEDKKGYVVRDRRRFDAEGAPRGEGEGAPAKAAPSPSAPTRPSGAAGAQGAGARAPAQPPSRGAEPPSRGVEPPSRGAEPPSRGAEPSFTQASRAAGPREPVDFAALVLSVATNAMVSLQGGSPDGRIPGRPNLAAAAQHIDILTMLAEKTRGNLTPEEDELLTGVLYDLRMNYVAIAQQLENPAR
ncbi:MAG: DUF1844 domain-containing protein [Deltaproteobacteria bacterium]|nr:DUF1844 domain-containing protein [Deltaproteobacteria bacterium]